MGFGITASTPFTSLGLVSTSGGGMWSAAAWAEAPWANGLGSTPSANTQIGGGAGRGPVKRNEPMRTAIAPRQAKAWSEDDEQALKVQLQLRDDDESLLVAIVALVASRRLH